MHSPPVEKHLKNSPLERDHQDFVHSQEVNTVWNSSKTGCDGEGRAGSYDSQ